MIRVCDFNSVGPRGEGHEANHQGNSQPVPDLRGDARRGVDRPGDWGTPHPTHSLRASRLRVRQKPGLKGTAGEDAREARTTYVGQFVRLRVFPVAATVPAGGIVNGWIREFCVIRGSEI